MRSIYRCVLHCLLAACAEPGPGTFGDDLTDPQLPARGTSDAQAWLAAGHYRQWHCEDARHPARAPSPHGANRICNNDALHTTLSGDFLAGAASVKEIYNGDAIVAYAIARKLSDGPGGDAWYWYEGNPNKTYANSEGADNCIGCHARAARDFVFTVVR
jgi:hypothetical protein